MEYTLKEIKPRIYLLTFDNAYDLALHFLRFQEYYENPVWRDKTFTILEFMEWYSKEYSKTKTFSYMEDWCGFNIPGYVIANVLKDIPDYNKYDRTIHDIFLKIQQKTSGKRPSKARASKTARP